MISVFDTELRESRVRFIYEDDRNRKEIKIIDAAVRSSWTVSDIFSNEEGFVSDYQSELKRLDWAPILVALAFGENTAFHGFGQRIAGSEDLSTKSWLSVHLLDESKHTEGFSKLLNYLYPSYTNQQDKLFSSRDALLFYGHTHRCDSLIEWLFCTQIAEVFGRHCYKNLHCALNQDVIAEKFLRNIISDEARHIAYIGELIKRQQENIDRNEWNKKIKPFVYRMTKLGRNMFEARKKGKNYKALSSLDIDVSGFCDSAEAELLEKYFCE